MWVRRPSGGAGRNLSMKLPMKEEEDSIVGSIVGERRLDEYIARAGWTRRCSMTELLDHLSRFYDFTVDVFCRDPVIAN